MAQDNTKKALLSFIITYHNEPVEMLIECIKSIQELNLQDDEYEIIVVDDGSDKSPINEMSDQCSNLLYIYQNCMGVSAARNKGMTIATSKYIQFVDADDELIPEAYNHCIEQLKKNTADMVTFNYTKRQHTIASDTFHITTYTSGASLMHGNNIKGSACYYVFRKEAATDLHFTEGIDYAEDEEFTARLLLKVEQVIVTDVKAYFYRQHDLSTTHDNRRIEKRLSDTHTVIYRLRNELDRLPKKEQAALQRRISQLTMDYLYNIIMMTRSKQQLNTAIATMRSEGLFPLPAKYYSNKYDWFRRIIGTTIGRTILLKTLPYIHKES